MIRRILLSAGFLFPVLLVLSQVQLTQQSKDANFDFSIYFTGNVRGNLEPCG